MRGNIDSNRIDNVAQLKGNFLVASPMIPDERFKNAIIFICENKASTFGLMINSEGIIKKFNKKFKNTSLQNISVYSGGPNDDQKLFLLHSNDKAWSSTLKINNNIAITAINEVIKQKTNLPNEYVIISGYTSWVQFQLERELSLGFWLPFQTDSNIIFDQNIKNKWKYCMDEMQLNTNTFAHYIGNS